MARWGALSCMAAGLGLGATRALVSGGMEGDGSLCVFVAALCDCAWAVISFIARDGDGVEYDDGVKATLSG